MHKEQTILLVDNEEQILAGLRLLPGLIAGCQQFGREILAAVDMETAIALLEVVDVDLIVIGGCSSDPLFPRRILLLQRHCPGALVVALVREENPAALVEVFMAAECHLCLSASRSKEELVWIICQEAERVAKEQSCIAAVLAAGDPGRKFRVRIQRDMVTSAGPPRVETGQVDIVA